MPKIYSRYDLPPQTPYSLDKPSLTQQHFKDEADINNILARYQRTGYLVDPLNPGTRQPLFDDYSAPLDFVESQTLIAHANQAFELLPSTIRKRFNNSPLDLLQFLEKEENRDEAIKLGLVSQPSPSSSPSPNGNPAPTG